MVGAVVAREVRLVAGIVRLLALPTSGIGSTMGHVPAPRSVVFVAVPGIQLLDLAGPLEVFDAANRLRERRGEPAAYRTTIATPDGARIRTSSGVDLGADAALGDVAAGTDPVDTVLVVGGSGTRAAMVDDF